jgi:hypothetical protein
MFFQDPIRAWLVRAFWRGIVRALELPVPEIYPRQDRLTGKGLGNLIRFPLWRKSHFADVTAQWKPLLPIKTMSAVTPISARRLKRAAADIGIELTPSPAKKKPATCTLPRVDLPGRVKRLLRHDDRLAARWRGETQGLKDTSRSAVVMSIACMLIRRCVPTAEIDAAVRHWCGERGYPKGAREDWIAGVIDGAYDFLAGTVGDSCFSDAQLPDGTPKLIKRAFGRAVRRRAASKVPSTHGRTSQ